MCKLKKKKHFVKIFIIFSKNKTDNYNSNTTGVFNKFVARLRQRIDTIQVSFNV